jgi:NADH/NAD ratio-sensing transcriptional regulator Rex
MARPLAPTQPHLARLRVERQHRLIEELRLAGGRHATAEDLAAALGVDVRTVERDISATARSALTRLLETLHPAPPRP